MTITLIGFSNKGVLVDDDGYFGEENGSVQGGGVVVKVMLSAKRIRAKPKQTIYTFSSNIQQRAQSRLKV